MKSQKSVLLLYIFIDLQESAFHFIPIEVLVIEKFGCMNIKP